MIGPQSAIPGIWLDRRGSVSPALLQVHNSEDRNESAPRPARHLNLTDLGGALRGRPAIWIKLDGRGYTCAGAVHAPATQPMRRRLSPAPATLASSGGAVRGRP